MRISGGFTAHAPIEVVDCRVDLGLCRSLIGAGLRTRGLVLSSRIGGRWSRAVHAGLAVAGRRDEHYGRRREKYLFHLFLWLIILSI